MEDLPDYILHPGIRLKELRHIWTGPKTTASPLLTRPFPLTSDLLIKLSTVVQLEQASRDKINSYINQLVQPPKRKWKDMEKYAPMKQIMGGWQLY